MRYFSLFILLTLVLGACNSPTPQENPPVDTTVDTKADTKANTMTNTTVSSSDTPPFQGKLHYQYTYESNSIPLGYLYSIRPNSSIFAYDLKNYQSTFIGADTMRYYYSSDYNRAISSKNRSFTMSCEDYGVNPDSLISFKVYDSEELILGQSCKVIEFQTINNFNRYHVSKEIFLPPDTYKKHIAYNWAFYGEQANGGIILRVEHHFPQFIMKGEITKVEPYINGERAWDIVDQVFVNACQGQI